jgi:hypothetical protein
MEFQIYIFFNVWNKLFYRSRSTSQCRTVALVQLLMGISKRTKMTTETDLLTIINKL